MSDPSPAQSAAIAEFFRAVKTLRQTKVIRSHRFLGDLGEFLCARTFGITLATNQREEGLDGHRGSISVQIKYHGGKSTTADLGNPEAYDEVYLVVGPESVLRKKHDIKGFLVYRFSSDSVKKRRTPKGKFHVSKGGMPKKPARRIQLV